MTISEITWFLNGFLWGLFLATIVIWLRVRKYKLVRKNLFSSAVENVEVK